MDSDTIEMPTFVFKDFDKIVHFLMFYGLSVIFFIEKYNLFSNKETILKFAVNHKYILIFILTGFLIEVFQPILSNRTRSLFDFLADTSGSYAGYFVSVFLKKFLTRKLTV